MAGEHRWSGAGYVCADCGAIKDTHLEKQPCPGPELSVVLDVVGWNRKATDISFTYEGRRKSGGAISNLTSLTTVAEMTGAKLKHGDRIKVTIEMLPKPRKKGK
jgi:hypothetical protein